MGSGKPLTGGYLVGAIFRVIVCDLLQAAAQVRLPLIKLLLRLSCLGGALLNCLEKKNGLVAVT